MKKSRNIILSVLLAVCAFCLCFALVGCKGGEKNAETKYGYGEEGFYYYDGADSSRYMLSLQSGTYMITVNNSTAYSGSYSYDEESGKVSFSGDGEFAATLGESALSLDVEGSGYSFKAFKYFDVSYVDGNGNVVYTDSVLNGQSPVSISGENLKDGYWFIDWYADSSNSAVYSFDTSIAGDTTIYGWFIEKNTQVVEHTVTLDYGDGHTETTTTMNGTIYKDLPSTYDGQTIIGWWVSATNKGTELTYKYEDGKVFDADTTLFAVYAGSLASSVAENGITWDTAYAASDVTITVTNANGRQVVSATVSSSAGSFTSSAFASLEAGTYTVEITSGNITETRVYVVHGLARVSLSSADIIVNGSGRVISFAPVDGADGYKITVSNGEKTVTEDLGSHTYYNFSDWEMTAEGITFVVTAYADGYADSVSDGFTYLLVLGSVTVDISDDTVSWNWVEGALEYVVTITDVDGNVIDSFRTSDTSFSLKYYENGTYDITVQPHTDGYYSEAKTYYGYAKDSLVAPRITNVTSTGISWEDVGADYYVVMINGVTYGEDGTIAGTTLYFSESSLPESRDGKYEISVKAVKIGGSDSPYSDVVIATKEFVSTVSYDKNTIYWNYDIEATFYGISVNGGEETYTYSGNSAEVTLTKAGYNTVAVTAYSDATPVGYAETEVYAYQITLDGNGAVADKASIYVAQGDSMYLGGVTKDHAELVGWYTLPDFSEGQSDDYTGKGSEVAEGSVFTGSGSMYLYAFWTYEYLTVTLDAGQGTLKDGISSVQIKYGNSSYVLPTPTYDSYADDFIGWYRGEGATDTKYTENNGEARVAMTDSITLYAGYAAVRKYTETKYQGQKAYAVSAGDAIDEVVELTIPDGYMDGGTRYDIIINSTAFNTCNNLKVINIPDTLKYIAITYYGNEAGMGAFAQCDNIEAVNVYATGDEPDSTKEIFYFSYDGVLYHKESSDSDGVELLYYPHGRQDKVFVMPEYVSNEYECEWDGTPIVHPVRTLPYRVLEYKAFEELVVSNTVTYVAKYGIYLDTSLKKVTFAEGGTEELVLEDKAIDFCHALTEVTLPARYTSFSSQIFYDCPVLVNVYFEEGGAYRSDGGIVTDATGSTFVYLPIGRAQNELDLGTMTSSTITSIADGALYDNTNIRKVIIPASVTYIGVSAFEGCYNITELVFEANANSAPLTIKSRAFYGCTRILSVTLPVNLSVMEENAFGGCIGLTTVYYDAQVGTVSSDLDFAANSFGSDSYVNTLEFGPNVPEIDFPSIFGSSRLEKIIIAEDNESYYAGEDSVVYNAQKTNLIYYPMNKTGAYEVLETTTNIGSGVFADRVNLTEITIGKNVNTIGDGAFSGCTYLTAINVAEGNTNFVSIAGVLYALEEGVPTTLIYCPIRNTEKEIEVPMTVTYVESEAFMYNKTVTKVSFVDTSEDAGEDARTSFEMGTKVFYNDSSSSVLATVVLPECTTGIPDNTFYYCKKLAAVNIPASVTYIGDNAFYYCSALVGDLSAHGESSFVKLPEGVAYIGSYAFYYCTKLAVTIPASVSEIGAYAFNYCWDDATYAQVPITFAAVGNSGASTTLTIGNYAFQRTQYATGLTLPKNVIKLGDYAFQYCAYYASGVGALEFEEGSVVPVIPQYCFQYAYFTSASIPASVTQMEKYALANGKLTSITFAEGGDLDFIGQYAVYSQSSLTSLHIPASVQTIDNYAFRSNSGIVDQDADGEEIDGLTFADGSKLASIGTNAFDGMKITRVTLPEGLTTLNQIFGSNTYLETVNLPSTLTTIGSSAFSGFTALTSFEIPEGVTTIGSSAFKGCTNLTSLTFAEGTKIESIGDSAFAGCTKFTSFTFPETTEDILLGASLFDGCTSLTVVTLSAGVKETNGALYGATALTEIKLVENHPTLAVSEEGNALYSISGETIDFVLEQIETLDFTGTPVKNISSYAFAGQTSLTEVKLPAAIAAIGDHAFYGCTALKTVTFAEGTEGDLFSLGGYAFYGCDVLEAINLPEGITEIPTYCFYGCMSLKDFDLPRSVTKLCSYCFSGAGNLAFKNSAVEYEGFFKIDLSNVKEYEGWVLYKSGVIEATFADDASDVSFYANLFGYCYKLEEMKLPEGMTIIPQNTFYNCTALKHVEIPSTVTEIVLDAFYGCTALEEIELPESITTLGSRIFEGCTSLTTVTIPNGITSLGAQLFEKSGITSFVFPESVTSVGQYCFQSCTSLEYVDFNHSYAEFTGQMIFDGCTKLATIENCENITVLYNYAFQNTALTEAHFGDALTTVGTYAFSGCTKLAEVSFGDGLKTIDSNAFNGCTSLRSVELPKGLTTIGQNAFKSCAALEYLLIPSTVSSTGSSIFDGVTCSVYIQNTPNYVGAYWNSSWATSIKGTAYYYTEDEPGFTADGTAYDNNYWYYDKDGNFCIWEYTPDVYTVSTDCYIEFNTTTGQLLAIYNDGAEVLFSGFETMEGEDTYIMVIEDTTYALVVDSTTMTATLTVLAD